MNPWQLVWTSSWRSSVMDSADRWWSWWFWVMWKMIWPWWYSDSLDGRPFCTLLRDVLHFLRFSRVLLEILIICVISLRKCLLPWINPKALLLHLGVHSTVPMMYSGSYQKIEALFIMVVVVVGWLEFLIVSWNLVIVPSLSVTYYMFINQGFSNCYVSPITYPS